MEISTLFPFQIFFLQFFDSLKIYLLNKGRTKTKTALKTIRLLRVTLIWSKWTEMINDQSCQFSRCSFGNIPSLYKSQQKGDLLEIVVGVAVVYRNHYRNQ